VLFYFPWLGYFKKGDMLMKFTETRKIDELGRFVIPAALRGLLNVTAGDALDVHYSFDDDTLILKRSEVNEANCGICKIQEKYTSFKGLNLCRECAGEIALLTLE